MISRPLRVDLGSRGRHRLEDLDRGLPPGGMHSLRPAPSRHAHLFTAYSGSEPHSHKSAGQNCPRSLPNAGGGTRVGTVPDSRALSGSLKLSIAGPPGSIPLFSFGTRNVARGVTLREARASRLFGGCTVILAQTCAAAVADFQPAVLASWRGPRFLVRSRAARRPRNDFWARGTPILRGPAQMARARRDTGRSPSGAGASRSDAAERGRS